VNQFKNRLDSGQVLAKMWALKARLNQPITGQVHVQVANCTEFNGIFLSVGTTTTKFAEKSDYYFT